jgi:AraC-like DNA-binding protein
MDPKDTSSNVEACECADALLEASSALRRELLLYEREIRRMRTRVLRGRLNPPSRLLPDLIAVRIRVNERFDELERCRRRWRVAFFQLQADTGMSLGAIAREWGLSRQLVSRLMSDHTETTKLTRV